MAQGMLNVQERMPLVKLVGTVHDEAIAMILRRYFSQAIMDEYAGHLCDIPWAVGCPITASGYAEPRYKKD